MLRQYHEALKLLEQALNFDPNNVFSLYTKGACLNYFNYFNSLQQLSNYSEAIVYYNKAILINPNFQLSKYQKTECEKQLNKKWWWQK